MNRKNITLALAVREQLRADYAASDRQHANRIEALRTEADMARRRYLAVDPSNRLVAATLEAEWNTRLETLTRAVAEREQLGKAHERAIIVEIGQEGEGTSASTHRPQPASLPPFA